MQQPLQPWSWQLYRVLVVHQCNLFQGIGAMHSKIHWLFTKKTTNHKSTILQWLNRGSREMFFTNFSGFSLPEGLFPFSARFNRQNPQNQPSELDIFFCQVMIDWKGRFFNTHRIHGTGIFTYIYHKNQPNVGKYTIHGSYGITIKQSQMNKQFQLPCLAILKYKQIQTVTK